MNTRNRHVFPTNEKHARNRRQLEILRQRRGVMTEISARPENGRTGGALARAAFPFPNGSFVLIIFSEVPEHQPENLFFKTGERRGFYRERGLRSVVYNRHAVGVDDFRNVVVEFSEYVRNCGKFAVRTLFFRSDRFFVRNDETTDVLFLTKLEVSFRQCGRFHSRDAFSGGKTHEFAVLRNAFHNVEENFHNPLPSFVMAEHRTIGRTRKFRFESVDHGYERNARRLIETFELSRVFRYVERPLPFRKRSDQSRFHKARQRTVNVGPVQSAGFCNFRHRRRMLR